MISSDRWVVAVTAGRWQLPGIMAAKSRGFKVLAIDGNSQCPGFQIADNYILADIENTNTVLESIERLNYQLVGSISYCSEAGMPLAAITREYFGLPGPNIELTKALTDKAVQRNIWKNAGVPIPDFFVFRDCQKAIEHCEANSGRALVVKPTDSAGSRGVAIISEGGANIREAIHAAMQHSKSNSIIIEDYMPGIEYTVETFCSHAKIEIIAITKKDKLNGAFGTVAFQLCTPELEKSILDEISNVVKHSFQALGYEHGPGHAEIILMDSGCIGVVEVAGRGGGFTLFDKFLPRVSGCDVVSNTIKILTGEKIDSFFPKHQLGILRFIPTKKGKVVRISGFDKANRLSNVFAEPFVRVGESVNNALSDGDRAACIISWGDNMEEISSSVAQAESFIQFEVV